MCDILKGVGADGTSGRYLFRKIQKKKKTNNFLLIGPRIKSQLLLKKNIISKQQPSNAYEF